MANKTKTKMTFNAYISEKNKQNKTTIISRMSKIHTIENTIIKSFAILGDRLSSIQKWCQCEKFNSHHGEAK